MLQDVGDCTRARRLPVPLKVQGRHSFLDYIKVTDRSELRTFYSRQTCIFAGPSVFRKELLRRPLSFIAIATDMGG